MLKMQSKKQLEEEKKAKLEKASHYSNFVKTAKKFENSEEEEKFTQ
jgi:hypothetical protein